MKKWYDKLSEDEWTEFLLLSRKDDACNKIWVNYQRADGNTSYDDVCEYEKRFWVQICRDKKLASILKIN
jgi:hypothetical protein